MPNQPSFEESLAKLEEIVRRLEEGNLPLEESVALFEEGTRLARSCSERLESAELRVSQLMQTGNGVYAEQDAADIDVNSGANNDAGSEA
jgi:exodeoxyribonuclease VII small subunit